MLKPLLEKRRLPSSALPAPPSIWTPVPMFPAIRLPAPATVPPSRLFETPSKVTPPPHPKARVLLPRRTVPLASVPM